MDRREQNQADENKQNENANSAQRGEAAKFLQSKKELILKEWEKSAVQCVPAANMIAARSWKRQELPNP